jgi:hypothetical protein
LNCAALFFLFFVENPFWEAIVIVISCSAVAWPDTKDRRSRATLSRFLAHALRAWIGGSRAIIGYGETFRAAAAAAGEREMSKKPKIDHEYHAGKDKLKITIQGYSLSKKARDGVMKEVLTAVERSPDRLIADAKKKSEERPGKKLRGLQKTNRLIEVGD